MDTELLKTFLEVERTRHFGKAATNLYLTQSAVSARIRLLEEMLGVSLFARTRHNIQLTESGRRLIEHAQIILQDWDKARRELAIKTENSRPQLRVGGVFSVWDIALQAWLNSLYSQIPDIAIKAEANGTEVLIRKISDGVLDVAFVLEPPQTLDLVCREMFSIALILTSTAEGQTPKTAMSGRYFMVDWGVSFALWHQAKFPHQELPTGHLNLGRIALNVVLANGGAAYLAESLCRPYMQQKQLFCVSGAPVFEYKLYALHSPQATCLSLLEDALSLLPKVP